MANVPTTQNQLSVAELYVGILGRNPDPAGFGFWVQQEANGATQNQIAVGFSNSPEFIGTYAAYTPAQAVNQMYLNIFNRTADTAGATFWTGQISTLVTQGYTSLQAYAIVASSMVTSAYNQGSGTTDGLTAYNKVNAAIAAGTSTPSTTYTLTTNTDVASATNFYGVVNGTTATTFTPGDTLTGTGSNATLTLADSGNAALTTALVSPGGASLSNVVNLTINGNNTGTVSTAGSLFAGVTNVTINEGSTFALTAGAAQNVNLNLSAGAATASSVEGGNVVNATVAGITGAATLNIGDTKATAGAITATESVSSTMTTGALGAITIGAAGFGAGGNVTVTENLTGVGAANTITGGAVSVTGGANTTSVTVNQSAAVAAVAGAAAVANTNNLVKAAAGVVDGAVTIADANAGSTTVANTIATVTLNGYGASTITSTALNTLSLGAGGTLGITEGGSAAQIAANTTLALNLAGGTQGVITDVSNQFKTVNVVLAAKDTLSGITDTALRTLNVSGTGVLTLSAVNTALTSVTTSGAAGLKANLSAVTGLTNINGLAGTGTNTITLNAALQAYVGGAGNDVVTIAADALQTITGGAGTNELVLNATAATFTAANTVANATGFTTLGLSTGSQGTYDTSVLTGFNAVDVLGAVAAATTVSKLAVGTALSIDAAQTSAITYSTVGTAGATSSVAVNLNGVASGTAGETATVGYTVAGLTLQDNAGNGIGNVTFNGNATVGGALFTVTTLTDNALTALTVAGAADLTVTNAFTTTATSLTISDNSTSTAGLTLGGVTDSLLTALTFNGTNTAAETITTLVDSGTSLTVTDSAAGNVTIGTLTAVGATTETFTNTSAGTLAIGTTTGAALATLNLNGAVTYTATADAVTTGVTVNGATDNKVVTLTLTGTTGTTAHTDTITLGNGNNVVSDAITYAAGQHNAANITVGTGANTVTLSNQIVGSVNFGAHAYVTADNLAVGANGTGTTLTLAPTVIVTATGLNNVSAGSDNITFGGDNTALAWVGGVANGTLAQTTTAQAAAIGDITNLATWVTAAESNNTAAHQVTWFNFGGNTYVLENVGNVHTGAFSAGDTLVKLTGTTSFTGTTAAELGTGVLHLLG